MNGRREATIEEEPDMRDGEEKRRRKQTIEKNKEKN